MRRVLILAAASLSLALAACTPGAPQPTPQAVLQDVQNVLAAAPAGIQAACTDALAYANLIGPNLKGGAANTITSVTQGVIVGCTTANGVATLAAHSSSAEWLGQQIGMMKAAVPPGAVPAIPAPSPAPAAAPVAAAS